MKIAVLVEKFPPEKCEGLELATQNIARHLALLGHDVHVVTMLDHGRSSRTIEDQVHVNRFSIPRGYLGYAVMLLKTFLSLGKIDAEINHAQTVFMGVPALFAKVLLKQPYVVWGRDDIYPPWRFKRLLSRLVCRHAAGVIALTSDMKNEILTFCDRTIYVIPNGVDFSRFGRPHVHESRRLSAVQGDKQVILFVGGLRAIKGLDYLLEAMSIIKQKKSRATLVLVGDGTERAHLKALARGLNIEERVTFAGSVPPERVPEYMVGADIFVLPSVSEAFPNVILEAMAAALPIVATRVGGVPEIVTDGVNGFVVSPRNPRALAEKVLALLDDTETRTRIAKANVLEAQKYTWENVVLRLEKVYRASLAS
jgi:glycosyltransferase involved in cell wall biosynthesis